MISKFYKALNEIRFVKLDKFCISNEIFVRIASKCVDGSGNRDRLRMDSTKHTEHPVELLLTTYFSRSR